LIRSVLTHPTSSKRVVRKAWSLLMKRKST
jgi:hypothetical protein